MNMKWLLGAVCASGIALGAAAAGELADACAARLEADGRDTSGCVCLEEQVAGDPALGEEMTRLGGIEDPAERYAAASDAAKAAMDACTR
jgi:hypothetical protein